MKRLLLLNTSPVLSTLSSRYLAKYFIDKWLQSNGDYEIIDRDTGKNSILHCN